MNTLHRPSGRTLMIVLTLGIMVLATGAATAETLIINAGRIDTGTGEIIENGNDHRRRRHYRRSRTCRPNPHPVVSRRTLERSTCPPAW